MASEQSMRLYLVRHPRPLLAADVCYGRSDVAVDPHEALRVAENLRMRLPSGLPVYSSPLQRCLVLAALLGTPQVDARLSELDFGGWEMHSWAQIAFDEVEHWRLDMAHYRPGNGESLAMMATRIQDFHAALLKAQVPEALLVCHGGSIRLLRHCGLGLSAAEMAQRAAQVHHKIDYGELEILQWPLQRE
jgi:alpha-ribazole phosphatase